MRTVVAVLGNLLLNILQEHWNFPLHYIPERFPFLVFLFIVGLGACIWQDINEIRRANFIRGK